MSGSSVHRFDLSRHGGRAKRTVSRFTAAVLLASLATAAGCSHKKVDNRKAVYPVHGKLLVDNQPAPGALLVLHPVGGTYDSERPVATVGPEGEFELTTYVTKDGAPSGEYIVTAQWYLSANKDAPGPWPNVIPEKYAKPESSDLRVRVAEGQNDLQPIVIKR